MNQTRQNPACPSVYLRKDALPKHLLHSTGLWFLDCRYGAMTYVWWYNNEGIHSTLGYLRALRYLWWVAFLHPLEGVAFKR